MWCAVMSNCNDLFSTQSGFESAECAAAVLDVLHDMIDALEMFPDEPANAWVVWYAFLCAIRKKVMSFRAMDRDVVDVGNGGIGNLWLKDASDIIMKNRDGVSPTHG